MEQASPDTGFIFPEGFLWGTAASAYQTEGNNYNNDWAIMEKQEMQKSPDKRRILEPCGKACDHWNRYKEDFDLAKEMGIQIHRLSIEWSRVFPAENTVDQKALEHYRLMLMALHQRNIKVMLCFHHFTIPRWLYEMGGFLNHKGFIHHFKQYIQCIIETLGDLVDYWLPINEPNVVPLGGYLGGVFPPFKTNPYLFIKVYRIFMDMHKHSYYAIKKRYPQAKVGVAWAYISFRPFRPWFFIDKMSAAVANRLANKVFLQGIQTGNITFPLGFFTTDPELKESLDFIGLNYYSSGYMKGFKPVDSREEDIITDMGWVFYPQGLYDAIQYLVNQIDVPILITENGVATLYENFRIQYLQAHLQQVHQCIKEGAPILGYMVWSLTDNFEWTFGFEKRFGLIYIDYETQKRSIKKGGIWYSSIIKKNSL